MSKLVLIAGPAGTGKSTYAKTHFDPNTTVIVSSDEVRHSITGDYRILCEDMNVVFDKMCELANEEAKKGTDTVIIDCTNLSDYRRNYFLDRITGFDETHLIMLKVHDLETVLKRNHQRIEEKWVPENVVRSMYEHYKEPSEENRKRYTSVTVTYVD